MGKIQAPSRQGRIWPLALVMVYHGRQIRGIEFACSEFMLAFLIHCLLPPAQVELNLLDLEARPGHCGILGATLGGLMALYTDIRTSHILDRVLGQEAPGLLNPLDSVS